MPEPAPLRVLHFAKWAPPIRGGMETVVRDLLNTHARREESLRIDCFCYSDTTANEQIAGNSEHGARRGRTQTSCTFMCRTRGQSC